MLEMVTSSNSSIYSISLLKAGAKSLRSGLQSTKKDAVFTVIYVWPAHF